ncbi:MAG: hypothetical protein GEU98_20390 [Pseudonocardiaceae bacterium]|nr:hypothetical protein [Pseudonocardiaceae bacterium]
MGTPPAATSRDRPGVTLTVLRDVHLKRSGTAAHGKVNAPYALRAPPGAGIGKKTDELGWDVCVSW